MMFVVLVASSILFPVITSQDVPGYLKHFRQGNQVSVETQTAAVMDLVKRLIPDYAASFSLSVDPNLGENGLDTFQVVYLIKFALCSNRHLIYLYSEMEI
jgi:hypothetical protein